MMFLGQESRSYQTNQKSFIRAYILFSKHYLALQNHFQKILSNFLTYRLKKIQEKKRKIKEVTEARLAAFKASNEFKEPASLLAEERDEDLLFN